MSVPPVAIKLFAAVVSIALFAMIPGITMQAQADLVLIGQGTSTHGTYNLIYDTDLDATWYDYSRSDGRIYHVYQTSWASALTVDFGGNIYDDWRLPTTVDAPYVYGYDGTTSGGYNITSSEMGHLFYTELGNNAYNDTNGNYQPDYGLTDTGDFQNLYPEYYWSDTYYTAENNSAWAFHFGYGITNKRIRGNSHYALAVHDGLVVMPEPPVAPEPISSTLFIVGGVTLGLSRFRKKFKN